MSKMRFGLYLIPEQGELYEAGSSIVGYDVRNERAVPTPSYLLPEWQAVAKQFGFHVTITDALYTDTTAIPMLTDRIRQLLGCLKADNGYVCTKDRVGFWGDGRIDAAMVLRPNRAVEVLHDVLVATMHPLSEGSAYTDALNREPSSYFPDSPEQVNKTRLFHAPYIFDDFVPHFTCLNPFAGSEEQRKHVEASLDAQFKAFETIAFNTICLVAQEADEPYFRIVEEFDLHAGR